MSLWLESAYAGVKLERLTDQLKNVDSLEVTWGQEFKFIQKNKFDAVVGNPPYVASKNANISTRSGQTDLYLKFIDLSLDELLAKGGRFAMIVPDPIMVRSNGHDIRKKIIDGDFSIESIVHLKDVFKEAKVSNIILILEKDKIQNETISFYRINNKVPNLDSLYSELSKNQYRPQLSILKSDSSLRFRYLLANDALSLRLDCLEGKIVDYFVDKRGEEISKKDILTSGKIKILTGGESIKPFQIDYKNSGYVKEIKKNVDTYNGNKVILQKSAPFFVAALDKKSYCVPQSIYIIKAKTDSPVDEGFLVALLNSDIANNYLFNNTTGYKLLMPHYEQKDIKQFPLPKFNFSRKDFNSAKKKFEGRESELRTCGSILALSAWLSALENQNADPAEKKRLANLGVEKFYATALSAHQKSA